MPRTTGSPGFLDRAEPRLEGVALRDAPSVPDAFAAAMERRSLGAPGPRRAARHRPPATPPRRRRCGTPRNRVPSGAAMVEVLGIDPPGRPLVGRRPGRLGGTARSAVERLVQELQTHGRHATSPRPTACRDDPPPRASPSRTPQQVHGASPDNGRAGQERAMKTSRGTRRAAPARSVPAARATSRSAPAARCSALEGRKPTPKAEDPAVPPRPASARPRRTASRLLAGRHGASSAPQQRSSRPAGAQDRRLRARHRPQLGPRGAAHQDPPSTTLSSSLRASRWTTA